MSRMGRRERSNHTGSDWIFWLWHDKGVRKKLATSLDLSIHPHDALVYKSERGLAAAASLWIDRQTVQRFH